MNASERRPWRAIIRVVSVDAEYVHVCVPAWNSRISVRLLRANVPSCLAEKFVEGFHCYAHVNIGATRQEDLNFTSWSET